MKDAPTRVISSKRSSPLLHKAALRNKTNSKTNKISPVQDEAPTSVDDSLAICLFGLSRTMYDSEYEEEVRKQAVMSEVLPDKQMWEKWEKTEAPLRQGRGWYPTLDRHFLDLLVMSEIHCLSHPLQSMQSPPGQAERIHRHASRVRRVACERIGAERLHAYCERVKEAFEAYVQCGWGARGTYDTPDVMEEDESSTDDEMSGVGEADESVESETSAEDGVEGTEEDEERGRSVARGDGSVERDISPGQMNRSNLPSMAKRMIEEAGEPPFAETRMEADSSEGDLKSLILEDVQEAEEEKTTSSVTSADMDIDVNVKEVRLESLEVPIHLGSPIDSLKHASIHDLPASPNVDDLELQGVKELAMVPSISHSDLSGMLEAQVIVLA